jgi:hypothetical protein
MTCHVLTRRVGSPARSPRQRLDLPKPEAKENVMFRILRRCALPAVFCLATATAARAQGLPDVPAGTVLSEVMMDIQGSEALLYGSTLGASPLPQSLSGTSMSDPSTGSFSFSLNPGSTYLGQSITDSVQGTFNSTTQSYDWTAEGLWAGIDWQIKGNVAPIEVDITGTKWELISIEQMNLPKLGLFDLPDKVTILGTGKDKPALSFRTSSLLQNGVRQGATVGTDTYNAKNNTFEFRELFTPQPKFQRVPLSYNTTGTIPFAGGAGTYTTTISSTPEPSTLVIGLLTGTGLFAFRWLKPCVGSYEPDAPAKACPT